jgi:GT2 family glycosyltransferase
MLVRRKAYEQVGGFDEGFFLYSEETDWQRRMKDHGFRIVFTPAAQVTHFGGASGEAEKAKVNGHFFESLDRYERKHQGWRGSFHCAWQCRLDALRAQFCGAWSRLLFPSDVQSLLQKDACTPGCLCAR